MEAIVTLKDVYKSFYTDAGEVFVLNGINLKVEKGKILAIVGPSGSGKSTILNLLTGIIQPTKGEVDVKGKVGYMFQKDHLLEWRNIEDNITIGLEIQKGKTKEAMDHIEHLLKLYGLWEFRKSYPRQLSGGMRQRVALIRTLATDPDLLLLDEPFSALDFQTRLMVSNDIYKIIRRENKEAILVTHDLSEAVAMADQVAVLSKRPATIKSVHSIDLEIEDKTPMSARDAVKFREYFNLIWKEVDVHD